MMVNKTQKGFTLIEIMATMFVLSFGIIVVYSIYSGLVMLQNTSSSRLPAVYLAKEGMEIVRNIRDSNFINNRSWRHGLSGCGNGCQADYKAGTEAEGQNNRLRSYQDNNFLQINSDGLYGYDAGAKTIYKRKIIIDRISNNTLKVTAQVFWDYSAKPYSFETTGYLYDWY